RLRGGARGRAAAQGARRVRAARRRPRHRRPQARRPDRPGIRGPDAQAHHLHDGGRAHDLREHRPDLRRQGDRARRRPRQEPRRADHLHREGHRRPAQSGEWSRPSFAERGRRRMSRILIVEDEPAIAELIAINLRHAGFEVTIAGDAEQAQAALDQVLPHLVILDWMLPGTSGHSLARQWRAAPRTRELPIIMLTARAEEAVKVSGLDAGADDYLSKPFSINELLARIRALLRRRSPSALDAVVEVGALSL